MLPIMKIILVIFVCLYFQVTIKRIENIDIVQCLTDMKNKVLYTAAAVAAAGVSRQASFTTLSLLFSIQKERERE